MRTIFLDADPRSPPAKPTHDTPPAQIREGARGGRGVWRCSAYMPVFIVVGTVMPLHFLGGKKLEWLVEGGEEV